MTSLYYQRGTALFDLGRYFEAEAEFALATADEPTSAEAWAMLAAAKCNQGRSFEAESDIREAIRLEPNSAYSHRLLAIVLLGKGEVKQAEAAIDEAMQLEPWNADHFAVRASACLAQDQWWQTVHWAKQGLALWPDHVPCLEWLIYALTEMELHDEADEVVIELLRIDPERGESFRKKGLLEFRKGNIDVALDSFWYGASQQPQFGDGVRMFEQLTKPSDRRLVSFLKRIPHLMHLRPFTQFLFMLFPFVAFTTVFVIWPDWRVASLATTSWAAATIAAFGLAYIVQPILIDVVDSIPRYRDPVTSSKQTWMSQIAFWLAILLAGLCATFLYGVLVAIPFFMPHIAVGELAVLTAVTGFRAVNRHFVRAAYRSPPESAKWLRELQDLSRVVVYLTLGVLLACGLVLAIYSPGHRKSTHRARSITVPKPPPSQVDVATGEMIDESGKRHKMGEAFSRLFGVPTKGSESPAK